MTAKPVTKKLLLVNGFCLGQAGGWQDISYRRVPTGATQNDRAEDSGAHYRIIHSTGNRALSHARKRTKLNVNGFHLRVISTLRFFSRYIGGAEQECVYLSLCDASFTRKLRSFAIGLAYYLMNPEYERRKRKFSTGENQKRPGAIMRPGTLSFHVWLPH